MAFGNEYTSDNVYFIAGGRTLALVKEYEEQKRSSFGPLDAIAAEFGGIGLQRDGSGVRLFSLKKLGQDWLNLKDSLETGSTSFYVYTPKPETAEGKALIDRAWNVPGPANEIFGKWLTGKQLTETNPDNLQDSQYFSSSPFNEGKKLPAATFERYGDTYVVAVPRVLRGIFNDESKKLSAKYHVPMSAGYTFEWFTPPDSQLVPYSKVLELKEQQLGDQLAAPVIRKKLQVVKPK